MGWPDAYLRNPTAAFTVFGNLKYINPIQSVEIDNMPPIQDQFGVGSCFGCAAATIVQKYLCDFDPDIKALQIACSQLPQTKLVSQLSMVAWADTNLDRIDPDPDGKNQIPGLSRNHTNIKLYNDATVYSSGSNALNNSLNLFRFMPNSCFPMDRLVGSGKAKDDFEPTYERLKVLFKNTKLTQATEPSDFPERLESFEDALNHQIPRERLISGLKKKTFAEFLYEIIFGGCKHITSTVRPKLRILPAGSEESIQKKDIFGIIRAVIDKKRPLLINAICLGLDEAGAKCVAKHSVVISGYRMACETKYSSGAGCRYQIKLHNCWGEAWQKASNDGWVDAEIFISFLNPGKPYVSAGEIAWLE